MSVLITLKFGVVTSYVALSAWKRGC